MFMRVIAGSARHIILKTAEGMDTRPTTDRIKETLFNMLQSSIPGCYFLDLFAGSGAIGIEALSRGAAHCDFVEQNPKTAAIIRDNLKTTRLEGNVYAANVFTWLAGRHFDRAYDYIFMDPPYDHMFERDVLQILKDSDAVDEYTTIIFEASLGTEFESYLSDMGFRAYKVKTYKTNKHVFIEKAGSN